MAITKKTHESGDRAADQLIAVLGQLQLTHIERLAAEHVALYPERDYKLLAELKLGVALRNQGKPRPLRHPGLQAAARIRRALYDGARAGFVAGGASSAAAVQSLDWAGAWTDGWLSTRAGQIAMPAHDVLASAKSAAAVYRRDGGMPAAWAAGWCAVIAKRSGFTRSVSFGPALKSADKCIASLKEWWPSLSVAARFAAEPHQTRLPYHWPWAWETVLAAAWEGATSTSAYAVPGFDSKHQFSDVEFRALELRGVHTWGRRREVEQARTRLGIYCTVAAAHQTVTNACDLIEQYGYRLATGESEPVAMTHKIGQAVAQIIPLPLSVGAAYPEPTPQSSDRR